MSKQEPPSVDRIAELQQLIADFASIQRMVSLADKGRPENDADHSFGLALTCWYLAPKIAPDLNIERILKYALAHDIVEIHAGDTFILDKEKTLTKSKREDDAIEQLQKDWSDFTEMTDAAKDYKDHADPEAKFVYVIDKLLPPLMLELSGKERDNYLKRHNISLQLHKDERRQKMSVSPEASMYFEMLHDWLEDHGWPNHPAPGD